MLIKKRIQQFAESVFLIAGTEGRNSKIGYEIKQLTEKVGFSDIKLVFVQSWLHICISAAYETRIPYKTVFTPKKAVLRPKIGPIVSSFPELSITCCGPTLDSQKGPLEAKATKNNRKVKTVIKILFITVFILIGYVVCGQPQRNDETKTH